MKTSQLITFKLALVERVYNVADYDDVDVYVTQDDGCEWLIRVMRKVGDTDFTICPARFAPSLTDSFDDGDTPEPPALRPFLMSNWAQVLAAFEQA